MLATVYESQSLREPRSRGEVIRAFFRGNGVTLFVWGVWALMFLVALAFVATYGANVPYGDDWWNWLPPLHNGQPITLSWLWARHGVNTEHRYPLQKLLLVGLYRITGDVRGAMVFDVLILAALAFALILAARRVRGRSSYADAFIPLVLLNLGHAASLLWAMMLCNIVPIVLIGVLLAIVVTGYPRPGLGAAILAGGCLVLLPLFGGLGVVVLPALALWLSFVALVHWRAGGLHSGRESLLILGMTVSALLLVLLYLNGMYSPLDKTAHTQRLGPVVILRSYCRLMGMEVFGGAISSFPRWGRAAGQFAGTALCLVSIVPLVPVLFRRTAERPRALGLLAIQGAMIGLALAMSLRRATRSAMQYEMFFVPGLLALYFTWMLYGPPRIRRFMTAALFLGQLVLALLDFQHGVSLGKGHKYRMAAFERDLRSGMPTYMLLGRYSKHIQFTRTDLEDAQRTGFGIFGSLQGDPEFREVPLPLEPTTVHDMAWDDGRARPIGDDPYLILKLPEARFIGGLRLEYSHEFPPRGGPEPFRISCKQDDSDHFTSARTRITRFHCLGPGKENITTWIGARVQQFRIRPTALFPTQPSIFAPTGLELRSRQTQDEETYALQISRATLLLPVQEDRFTAQAEDVDVPRDSRSEADENLMSYGEFAGAWPVDLLHSLPVFFNDILFGVRP